MMLTRDRLRSRLLARHPDVLFKLRAEIEHEIGSALPQQNDIKRMTYLSYVLKEGKYLASSPPQSLANKAHIFHSAPPLPFSAGELAHSALHDDPSPGRRRRWSFAHPDPARNSRGLLSLLDAPPHGPVRRRRPSFSAGALGRWTGAEGGVGLCAVQWRAEGVFGS